MVKRRGVLCAGTALLLSNYARAQPAGDSFEALLADVEADGERFPGAAGQLEAKALSEIIFGAAQPPYGKSARAMNERTVGMLAAFEVSNAKRYAALYQRPVWPGKDSGVTIGIGYDLGYAGKLTLEADWRDYLSSETRALLATVLGLKRTAAQASLRKVQAVEIPYTVAYRQFLHETLPKYVAQTEHALPNTSKLSDDSMGALVSLTFNRGASYLVRADNDKKEQFREMRAIRQLMRDEKFADIPMQIRSMKRLWIGAPGVSGLIARRELEARLFERGLARGKA